VPTLLPFKKHALHYPFKALQFDVIDTLVIYKHSSSTLFYFVGL